MSSFHFDLGRLEGRLIAVDGAFCQPVSGRRFPINVAQRLDIVLRIPRGDAVYPLLATVEGERRRTGIVLAVGKGVIARAPAEAPAASPPISMALESRLRAAEPLKSRQPDRVLNLDLTGEMSKYIWSINGVAWHQEVPPLLVAKGERVALVMTNSTGMPHPVHLHGHRFQVVEIGGLRFSGAVRDTVACPRRSVSLSNSTPTIRAFGRFIATCSTTWKPACFRRSAISDPCHGRCRGANWEHAAILAGSADCRRGCRADG